MVANFVRDYFCMEFIFSFFMSQEPFVKVKTKKFCCPCSKRVNYISIRPTSNYLANRSLSMSVPLMAIAQDIQEI